MLEIPGRSGFRGGATSCSATDRAGIGLEITGKARATARETIDAAAFPMAKDRLEEQWNLGLGFCGGFGGQGKREAMALEMKHRMAI